MKVSASLTAIALAASASAAPSALTKKASYDRCTTGRTSADYLKNNIQPWIEQLVSVLYPISLRSRTKTISFTVQSLCWSCQLEEHLVEQDVCGRCRRDGRTWAL